MNGNCAGWLLLWTVGLAACGASIRPHASQSGPVFGAPFPSPAVADSLEPAAGSAPMARNTCRAAGLSSAWVIVDYVEDEDCPSMKGERGAELLVCADQRIPRGWARGGAVDDATLAYLCQTSIAERSVTQRVMRIHKQ